MYTLPGHLPPTDTPTAVHRTMRAASAVAAVGGRGGVGAAAAGATACSGGACLVAVERPSEPRNRGGGGDTAATRAGHLRRIGTPFLQLGVGLSKALAGEVAPCGSSESVFGYPGFTDRLGNLTFLFSAARSGDATNDI